MTKPFFGAAQGCGNIQRVSGLSTKPRATAAPTGDHPMRPLSLILAAAMVLAGSSMAGSSESGLPGVGTFAYAGSPVAPPAAQIVVLAAR